MKLYEINAEILRLTDQSEFDEETGEILCDIDAIYDVIGALQMEKKSVLEYLAKIVLNLCAEAATVKTEEQRLKECHEKTILGVATFSYRNTSHVDVPDAAKVIRCLKRNKHLDCFRVPAPEVAKTEVKKSTNAGTKALGCTVVEDCSCSLR